MRVEDPAGNRLTSVVLLVTERDGELPRTLRYLRDDETVDVSEANNRQFLIVWVATDFARAETGLSSMMDQIYQVTAKAEEVKEANVALRNDVEWVRKEHDKITAELAEKTAALRQLQRERDPSRIDREVAERVAAATADLEARLGVVKQTNLQLQREADELRTSKKRLREALDRTKR